MDYLGNSVKTSHVENPNGDMSLVKDICSDPLVIYIYIYIYIEVVCLGLLI